jgi:MoaA/NifB/PqqE/SkfB family radical SAM enzyme
MKVLVQDGLNRRITVRPGKRFLINLISNVYLGVGRRLVVLRRSFQSLTHPLGSAPWPKNIAFPLTGQCNYRCGFCEIVGVSGLLKSQGLPYNANLMTAEYLQPFSPLIQMAHSIDFGGMTGLGEPLLSPHIESIVRAIRDLNRTVTLCLTTNASLLTPEVSDLLVRNAPLHMTFSLHAASAEVYGKMMGPRFEQVIANIEYFCRKAQTTPGMRTTINFGFGKLNYMDAETIVSLAHDLGVDAVNIYPYYKSPNKFVEDMSLYSDPERANRTLTAAYRMAGQLGQCMFPPQPAYLRPDAARPTPGQSCYTGGCRLPFENYILKSAPSLKDRIAFCVCNRITLFTCCLDRELPFEDILWMWNHPALNDLRFPKGHVPEICRFCRSPETPWLRSLDQEEYKRRRDRAVREHLAMYQSDKIAPNQSIELLSENIFSID